MRRLYLHVYLAFCGILLLFALLSGLVFHFASGERAPFEGLAEVVAELLPPASAPPEELERALARLATRLRVEAAIYGADRALLAPRGTPLPLSLPASLRPGWLHEWGPPSAALELPDGRWLLARRADPERRRTPWLASLALGALAIALGSYPLARRITRRLERLQTRIDALGAGELGARVEVEGRDEVARLARSFNRAAQRIEQLVNSQRRALASASHELRTPLARLRLALELLAGEERSELREQAARDIAELDALIGELLLASQLDAGAAGAGNDATLDLLALVAEEAARVGAELQGVPVALQGDPRLLRRLVRNLLENARRYGGGSAIEVTLAAQPAGRGGALLVVEDRGPGVPAAERERVFEPFYRLAGARGAEGGVGLGLALVRQIARHHGGDARCCERPGGGTRFEVELAGAPAPAVSARG